MSYSFVLELADWLDDNWIDDPTELANRLLEAWDIQRYDLSPPPHDDG